MAAEHPPEFVVVSLKDIRTTVTKDRVWFGFPHYVVLGWALLVSYTVYGLVDWRDNFERERTSMLAQNTKTLTELADAIASLQTSTRRLEDDGIKTRMILELKFPQTARQIDDAFDFDGEGPDK